MCATKHPVRSVDTIKVTESVLNMFFILLLQNYVLFHGPASTDLILLSKNNKFLKIYTNKILKRNTKLKSIQFYLRQT